MSSPVGLVVREGIAKAKAVKLYKGRQKTAQQHGGTILDRKPPAERRPPLDTRSVVRTVPTE
jgi:hypothetical protein